MRSAKSFKVRSNFAKISKISKNPVSFVPGFGNWNLDCFEKSPKSPVKNLSITFGPFSGIPKLTTFRREFSDFSESFGCSVLVLWKFWILKIQKNFEIFLTVKTPGKLKDWESRKAKNFWPMHCLNGNPVIKHLISRNPSTK